MTTQHVTTEQPCNCEPYVDKNGDMIGFIYCCEIKIDREPDFFRRVIPPGSKYLGRDKFNFGLRDAERVYGQSVISWREAERIALEMRKI